MKELLTDPKLVVSIIAIINTIILALIFQWWRNRKNISYEIISSRSLLTANEEIRERVKVLYDGNPVKNVRLFIIRIINKGKQSVDEKDFKKPIDFIFSDDAEILSAETVVLKPANLSVNISSDGNKLSIDPTLLNSKDFFEIKAIVSTYDDSLRCDARISGIKEVKENKESPSLIYWLFMISLVGWFLNSILESVFVVWVSYNSVYTDIYTYISTTMSTITLIAFFWFVRILNRIINNFFDGIKSSTKP